MMHVVSDNKGKKVSFLLSDGNNNEVVQFGTLHKSQVFHL
jgi:hypothetical protein